MFYGHKKVRRKKEKKKKNISVEDLRILFCITHELADKKSCIQYKNNKAI